MSLLYARAFDALDVPGDAGYSPSRTANSELEALGTPVATSSQDQAPRVPGVPGTFADNLVPTAESLRPPDPAFEGEPGQTDALGWSTGINNPRSLRQIFTGRTLVMPDINVNPQVGPVGFDKGRSQKLANGVAALSTDYTPSAGAIADSFLGVSKPSVVMR